MRILITGCSGFVGRRIAEGLLAQTPGTEILGLDNLSRPGSEANRLALKELGVKFFHADVRCPSDLQALPEVDWVLDCAANPSVLAGVDGRTSSRQVVEHNLLGTLNTLEFCKERGAGFIMLSTSRVYSILPLSEIRVRERDRAFVPDLAGSTVPGLSEAGVAENFPTSAPISLYGGTKLASEVLALEYLHGFGVPVWLNRCGVLAGPGQFGKADQGIFSFWIHSYLRRKNLKFIGFGGDGLQVRDCLDPLDLVPALLAQMAEPVGSTKPRVVNFAGGAENAISLVQLHDWCAVRFGFEHPVAQEKANRQFDIPWMVLDSSLARETWGWEPQTRLKGVLELIAQHAEANPGWLELSQG